MLGILAGRAQSRLPLIRDICSKVRGLRLPGKRHGQRRIGPEPSTGETALHALDLSLGALVSRGGLGVDLLLDLLGIEDRAHVDLRAAADGVGVLLTEAPLEQIEDLVEVPLAHVGQAELLGFFGRDAGDAAELPEIAFVLAAGTPSLSAPQ